MNEEQLAIENTQQTIVDEDAPGKRNLFSLKIKYSKIICK